jgi:ABC-type Mn2+/Zn2+ transport system permease subunit
MGAQLSPSATRGRSKWIRDRVLGIVLGIVLGLAVIILFLFLGSRSTIDEPSLSGGATTQTQAQPATPPAKASKPKPGQ